MCAWEPGPAAPVRRATPHTSTLLLLLAAANASPGDRDPAYRSCVAECATAERCAAWQPAASLRLLGWSCAQDCGYTCMWRVVEARAATGARTLQYHGKWPFVRVLGVQEPVSALLSAANGAVHCAGLVRCWPVAAQAGGLRGWLWRGLGLAAVHAWLWATIFHCRDLYWTQCADYFSALALVFWGCFVASVLLVDECARPGSRLRSSLTPLALGSVGVAAYAAHVGRMLRFFDFGRHMKVSLAMGVLHLLLYVGWWRKARWRRPHAWRAVALNTAVSLSVVLEVLDFPPLLSAVDAHALWHASTAPLAHLLWTSFVEPELRWCVANPRVPERT